ncbi:hypothetical protein GCM10027610_015560 [Dactylosporangium cerinum]
MSDSSSVRRNWISIIGPRMTPRITGAIGNSKWRMNTATTPIANAMRTSTTLPDTAYTPSVANTRMPVYSSGRGICSTFTQIRIIGRFNARSMTLPMNSDAISPHTRVGDFSNNCGPGDRSK